MNKKKKKSTEAKIISVTELMERFLEKSECILLCDEHAENEFRSLFSSGENPRNMKDVRYIPDHVLKRTNDDDLYGTCFFFFFYPTSSSFILIMILILILILI
jgi:hypothetical protein